MRNPFLQMTEIGSSAPKFTIKHRTEEKQHNQTPGPNYAPPAFGSESPKACLHIRPKDHPIINDQMGPGAFDVSPRFGSNAPKYSLRSRPSDTFAANDQTPGPGKYNGTPLLPNSPRYSIGRRPSPPKNQKTPGPGEYSIQSDFGNKRMYLHGRPAELQKEPTPGPAAYVPPLNFGSDAPKMHISNKYEPKSQRNYGEYVLLDSTVGQGPKFKIGGRHPLPPENEATPGPYSEAPKFGADGKKMAIHPRCFFGDHEVLNPGPGDLDTSPGIGKNTPKISFHGRNGSWIETSDTPGPSAYAPNMSTLSTKGFKFPKTPREHGSIIAS